MQKTTWLVTGGSGFIGSHFVRDSLARDADLRIINLDAQTYAACPLTLVDVDQSRYQLVAASINDAELVKQLLAQHQPDTIIHFAAESHVDRSIEAPDIFLQTNVQGTLNCLQQAHHYWQGLADQRKDQFRFLHISTDEVYGSLGPEGAFSEDTPYQPNSPYAASKAAADHLVRAWHHTYGLPVLTTNCSNNYGTHQYPEKLIPLMILKALAGEALPVYGDGQQIRDWLHVSDHVRALWRVLEAGQTGRVYNIGGNNEQANLAVVDTICAQLDELQPEQAPHKQLIEFVTDRPGHDRRYAINAERIHTELGWQPQVDFSHGLHQTVNWYMHNDDWITAAREAYQGQRLGLGAA